MWPRHLDIRPEDCPGILRRLELNAYSSVVSALRAQGDLTKERRKVLSDLSSILNVSVERHKTEVRRAVNDELLATVARSISGQNCENDWAREGRRIIPLVRRAIPITAFTPRADVVKNDVAELNQTLKPPSDTRTSINKQKALDDKGLMPPPPPPLSEIVENGGETVKPPSISLPGKHKSTNELVYLPSGMVVRIKMDPKSEGEQQNSSEKNRRKRKSTPAANKDDASPDDELTCTKYDLLPPGSMQSYPGGMLKSALHATTPKIIKRRKSSKNSQNQSTPNLPEPGHDYARSFLPQHPSPLHELEGRLSNSPLQPGSGKTMFLSPAEGQPPQISQYPRPPVSVSPQKKTQAGSGAKSSQSQTPKSSKSRAKGNQIKKSSVAQSPSTPGSTMVERAMSSELEATLSAASAMATMASGNVAPPPKQPGLQNPRPIIVSSSTSSSSSSQVTVTASKVLTTPIQLKDGSVAQGFRVLPPGSRILPKPGTTGVASTLSSTTILASQSAAGISGGGPVFMVATSSGQPNMMRLTRAIPASTLSSSASSSDTTSYVTGSVSTSGQRLVTVSSGALKGVAPLVTTQIRTQHGAHGSVVRTLQPRSSVATVVASGGVHRPGTPNRVIVVQRPTKQLITGQRILQTKDGKSVMIVSKTPHSSIAATALSSSIISGSSTLATAPVMVSAASQGKTTSSSNYDEKGENVIVLDMSQQQQQQQQESVQSNVLSDIMKATGISSATDSEELETDEATALPETNAHTEAPDDQNGESSQNHQVKISSSERSSNGQPGEKSTKEGVNVSVESSNAVVETRTDTVLAESPSSMVFNHDKGETVEDISAFIENTSSEGARADMKQLQRHRHTEEDVVEVANAMAALADSVVVASEDHSEQQYNSS